MKIIVTGGAGFIASHIVDAYIDAGHTVVVIDNLRTGFRKNLHPRAKFYKADIRDVGMMEKIFKKEKPEVVNHHAAIAEVVKSLEDPAPTFEVNVLGTANILSSFGRHGKGSRKKFIFASTGGAVYGNPRIIPATEKNAIDPPAPYGLSKLLGEETIKFYAKLYGFDTTIFRYANVYGPRQNPKGEAGVVAIFGRLMKSGVQPTIFGDGTKSRDYVYVKDVARANKIALSKGAGYVFNIGTGKTTTDLEVFETVAKHAHFIKPPRFAAARKGEVYKISLDAARAKKILGWNPKTTFSEGVRASL